MKSDFSDRCSFSFFEKKFIGLQFSNFDDVRIVVFEFHTFKVEAKFSFQYFRSFIKPEEILSVSSPLNVVTGSCFEFLQLSLLFN